MNKNVAFAAIFLTMMGGCASAPTQEQTAHADYGAPMSPEQCTMLVEEVLRRGLRDPEAAEFHHGPACHQGWGSSVPIFGMKAIFGYTQRGEINGKNAFGAYVGYRKYFVIMRNGRVVRYCMDDADGICLPVGEKQ